MNLRTPYYIVYEEKLRRNLNVILRVSREADVKIIMAFKANALWRTFPIFREYGICSTASSVNEMLLANDELECLAHTYCPAYTDETIEKILVRSEFSGNTVTTKIYYKAMVYGIEADVVIATFTGNKE